MDGEVLLLVHQIVIVILINDNALRNCIAYNIFSSFSSFYTQGGDRITLALLSNLIFLSTIEIVFSGIFAVCCRSYQDWIIWERNDIYMTLLCF